MLPVAFFLARYGNEAYEQVPTGELAATQLGLCPRRARREAAVAEHRPRDRRHAADALVVSGSYARSTTFLRSHLAIRRVSAGSCRLSAIPGPGRT